jgi:hypothetical protein
LAWPNSTGRFYDRKILRQEDSTTGRFYDTFESEIFLSSNLPVVLYHEEANQFKVVESRDGVHQRRGLAAGEEAIDVAL